MSLLNLFKIHQSQIKNCNTHRSSAMATKCKIDAVQHRTSLDVHISHNSGPNDHSRDTS